jgi:hypothetical protein
MLEHSCLHIEGWTRQALPTGETTWRRRITDAGGLPLGHGQLVGDAGAWWFSWLRSLRLEVYETEDASHLMSLVRSWGMLQVWEVYDAEERRVGSLYSSNLVDAEGERRGYVDLQARGRGRIFDRESRELAALRWPTPGMLELAFPAEANPNPFLRMLILGSVLTLDPLPKS